MIGLSGSLIWSKTLMKLILTPVVNFGEVRRAQLAKSTLLISSRCPWDLLKSVQMRKREWGRGKQREATLPVNPYKTANLAAKTTGSIIDVGTRQNKKCSCARKSGRRKNNAGTDKEEGKKLAGPLAKKELPTEGCSRRYGKWEESSRQKKISDDRQHYDKWTVCRYEKEG